MQIFAKNRTPRGNALEQSVEKNPTPENVAALFQAYTADIRADIGNAQTMSERVSRIVELSGKHQRFQEGLEALGPLAMLNPSLQVPRDGMKAIFSDMGETGGIEYLDAMSVRMFNDSLFRLDPPIASMYAISCEAFANAFDGASSTVEILHKAAETCRTLRNIDKALTIYDRLIEKHPDHPRGQQALFLKGFTYDNDKGDLEKARQYYEEFIAKYPDNAFAESAAFLLENLGKSDEELLEVLQKKQQEGQ